MKSSPFNLLLSVILASAVGFVVYDNVDPDSRRLMYSIGMVITMLIVTIPTLGFKLENSRANVNLKIWGCVALIVMIILNTILICVESSPSVYVLVLVVGLIIHLLVTRGITKMKDV